MVGNVQLTAAQQSSFPKVPFARVKIFSQDRALDSLEYEQLHEQYMHGNSGVPGLGFLNVQRTPIHKHYTEKELTREQIDKLLTIFRPTRPVSEGEKNCGPIFRDAIVFYNQSNKPVAHVELCFDCHTSYFSPATPFMVNFDNEGRYEELDDLFNEVFVPLYQKTSRF